MDWEKLYTMQRELDRYIINNHDLMNKNFFNEKYLAFLVELGELANETRCFKYWSKKKPSARETILAEYVDGIHFLLSLGLEKDYRFEEVEIESAETEQTNQFNIVFSAAAAFKADNSLEQYQRLFSEYLVLGGILGFSKGDVYQAYIKKNEINYERQDKGY